MSYIECDQNTRPRARSQSHSPQRPRLSAVSTRLRTVSWMMSASRARVACQWKAKPRISTTKPVVADSVTVSAVVERQSASASLRLWMTARRPTGFFSARTVAKAVSPSGSAISMVPAAAPNVVSGCDGPSTSRIWRPRQLRLVRHAGDDRAVAVGDQNAPAGAGRPDRQRLLQRFGGARQMRSCPAADDRARWRNDRRAPRCVAVASNTTWRRCSSTCTAAPTQIVNMKATMRTGTARRSSGSAVSRRRYAGLAIDCASPLIESERRDALAASARAIACLRSDDSVRHPRSKRCAASLRIVINKNRCALICREFASQYFFKIVPSFLQRNSGSPIRHDLQKPFALNHLRQGERNTALLIASSKCKRSRRVQPRPWPGQESASRSRNPSPAS